MKLCRLTLSVILVFLALLAGCGGRADEEPIDDILDRYKIMTGDLFSVRDNLERIITFITIIASHMSIT